jgi:Tfp pilus tip-associated adhesin PilY1
VVVAAPPFFYPFDDYGDFMVDRVFSNPREAMVYVGSNDGLLHAFSLETGEEKWAFLPHFLHDKLSEAGGDSSKDMCSGGYCYRHLLDGSAQPADVYAKFGGSDDQWRTVLIIGQREGGDAYLALDVTSGESFDPGNPDPAKWLWEFTDSELGQTWSKPSVERVAVADVTGEPTADRTWGVFFSSGYAIDDSQQAAKQAYVYGIVADDKSDLWKNEDGTTTNRIKVSKPSAALYYKDMTKPFYPNTILEGAPSGASATIIAVETTGATSGILTLENVQGVFQNSENLTVAGLSHAKADGTLQNIVGSQSNDALASPLLVDEDGSYTADRIYVGNLYGTMFRIQDIGKGQAPAVSKLFQFDPYPSTPDVNPVRGMAAYAYACNDYGSYCSDNDLDVWVYWGTGKYEDQADQSNQDVQYFFGVKEDDSTTYSLEDLNIGQAEFASATVGSVNYTIRYIGDYIQENAGDNPSWAVKLYVDASGGSERVLTAPLVVGKIAFFTTFIPDSNVCTGSGDTYVFAVEYLTGKAPTYPVFDLNGDGKFTDADKVEVNGEMIVPVGLFVGRGQGSQPVLHKDTLFITTTVADYQMGSPGGEPTGLVAKKVNIPDSRIRTEAWRQN